MPVSSSAVSPSISKLRKYILNSATVMTSKEFFYLVAEMRETQRRYFETHDRATFRAARALENDVDREIRRVRAIIQTTE